MIEAKMLYKNFGASVAVNDISFTIPDGQITGVLGRPGCGKSTVGVVLAKTTGLSFLDTDLLIQDREQLLLQQIIDAKGLSYFMKAEEEALCSVQCDNTVIATGGSAVYSEQAMRHLKSLGVVVYISLSLQEVEKRLNNLATRGIAGAADKSLAELYAERIPLYEQYADFIIPCDGISLTECMEKIRHQLRLTLL